jgi:hypothetical protein
MILCLQNLEAGVDWWKGSGWGADLVNSEYIPIFDAKCNGITAEWWDATVNRLWTWKAIRSRNPPNTVDAIRRRGMDRLSEIAVQFDKIQLLVRSEPYIADLDWEDISELFGICFEIKCCNRTFGSPVFASKMCHFLFPRVFPVVDNFATGTFEYEFYWRGMRDEWNRFHDKEQALELLRSSIEADRIHPLYPFETKIIELSHIGYSALSESYKHRAKFTDHRGWHLVAPPPSDGEQ